MRSLARLVAHSVLLPAVVAAGFGFMDRERHVALGPAMAQTLPLRATGGFASVPLLLAVPVWIGLAIAWCVLLPTARPVWSALTRGALVAAVAVVLQATTMELVHQTQFGFLWGSALRTEAPWLAGGVVAATTAACALLVRARRLRADARYGAR